MKKAFLLGQSNEVIKDSKVYDLHNQYDFSGIVLKWDDRRLKVLFNPRTDYGDKAIEDTHKLALASEMPPISTPSEGKAARWPWFPCCHGAFPAFRHRFHLHPPSS